MRVRMPEWITPDESLVACTMNALPRTVFREGRYVKVGPVQAGDLISVTFPIAERVERGSDRRKTIHAGIQRQHRRGHRSARYYLSALPAGALPHRESPMDEGDPVHHRGTALLVTVPRKITVASDAVHASTGEMARAGAIIGRRHIPVDKCPCDNVRRYPGRSRAPGRDYGRSRCRRDRDRSVPSTGSPSRTSVD